MSLRFFPSGTRGESHAWEAEQPAVVAGRGRSSGCLDHLGPDDAADLETVVEWLAHPDRPWSAGEWNRVGMTGHSYVGSTPSVAAAQDPLGLATIVPSAGLASMYDHQFQSGVPYFLQWAGPQWTYAYLGTVRHLPPIFAADIPVFMVHGVNDNAARIPAAEWFFGERFGREGDKVWLGQWDHGSAGASTCPEAHPNCRFEQWQYALHAWFDRHLQLRDVDTGPPVEVFLNDGAVATAAVWDEPGSSVTLHPDARDMSLRLEAPDGEGRRHPMTFCALQPHLREGVDTSTPVVPGQVMAMEPQCFTMAHHVRAGEGLVLSVRTTSPHHLSNWSLDPNITVATGPEATALDVPLHGAGALFADHLQGLCPPRDVGVAQEGLQGTATVVGPSPFLLVFGVTAATVEFEVLPEFDNHLVTAVARPSIPADVDLYLQQWDDDSGAWGPLMAPGTSRNFEIEHLEHPCPEPGLYRLLVHDHLGPPTTVDYELAFLNQEGEPGG